MFRSCALARCVPQATTKWSRGRITPDQSAPSHTAGVRAALSTVTPAYNSNVVLQRLPKVRVETKSRLSSSEEGFLALDRRRCFLLRGEAGMRLERAGAEFTYDFVRRWAPDAAAIVAYCFIDGQPHVYLRSCVRPPLSFREEEDGSFQAPDGPCFWELPAGIIEEKGPFEEAARACAARELHEELGFDIAPEQLQLLGPPVYPLPAMIAERQVFFCVEVDPQKRGAPAEDGSPLENEGQIICIPLRDALSAVSKGMLPDSKTELGLRRFQESWPSRAS